jgi:hypothetical protein
MHLHEASYRRELGEGLLLRWSTGDDSARVGELLAFVFRERLEQPPTLHLASWAADMLSGRHPLTGPDAFALVEDTQSGKIVAAASFLDQTWEYAGIPFGVGRPETVATLPEYRQRGLVRQIFELLHARSAARGQLAQAITGIAYFYRQFGYEYALDLGGGKHIYFDAIPRLKQGEHEPYQLRDPRPDELPLLLRLYQRELDAAYEGGPCLLRAQLDEGYLSYLLDGVGAETGAGLLPQAIVDAEDVMRGYLLRWRSRWDAGVGISALMLDEGFALAPALPSILRALRAQADELPVRAADAPPANHVHLNLGRQHQAYRLLSSGQTTGFLDPYAWYVRIPDLPAFLRRIAPALEERLAGSALAGYSGELHMTFYRDGLRLVFEGGRLRLAESWREPVWGEPRAQAGFPPLVFIQLLLGHRSLGELRQSFPDVWAKELATPLLEALFPRRHSWVLPWD